VSKLRLTTLLASVAALAAATGCDLHAQQRSAPPDELARVFAHEENALARAALERTRHDVRYDPAYVTIDYPGGDVPADTGVCTDVVVRAYRALGIDLQHLVHEDMSAAFSAYPRRWGLDAPDPNIDHRRVPNLQVFFERQGAALPVARDPDAYRPGDLVTWTVAGHRPHIGIVVGRRSADGERPLVVHNIGHGPRLEDILFEFPITGHYRFASDDSAPQR
jgi:hypothetical protein